MRENTSKYSAQAEDFRLVVRLCLGRSDCCVHIGLPRFGSNQRVYLCGRLSRWESSPPTDTYLVFAWNRSTGIDQLGEALAGARGHSAPSLYVCGAGPGGRAGRRFRGPDPTYPLFTGRLAGVLSRDNHDLAVDRFCDSLRGRC